MVRVCVFQPNYNRKRKRNNKKGRRQGERVRSHPQFELLGDEYINLHQAVLARQFPGVGSWQTPSLASHPDIGYALAEGVGVQVVNIGNSHWLALAKLRNGLVYGADSCFDAPTDDLIVQIVDLFHDTSDRYRDVHWLAVQRQEGGMACGYYAIVFAAMFARLATMSHASIVNAFASTAINEQSLPQLLQACLTRGAFDFQGIIKPGRPSRLNTPRAIVYRIDCVSGEYTKINNNRSFVGN